MRERAEAHDLSFAFSETSSLRQVPGSGLIEEEMGATDREKLSQLMSHL